LDLANEIPIAINVAIVGSLNPEAEGLVWIRTHDPTGDPVAEHKVGESSRLERGYPYNLLEAGPIPRSTHAGSQVLPGGLGVLVLVEAVQAADYCI
jgi:hypothetical protein